MPFKRKRPDLVITQEVQQKLVQISKSRSESASRIERSKMLLEYSQGSTVSAIARQLSTNRPKVERCIDKALQLGPLTALDDLPRPGKPPKITPEAKAWVVNLACQKPKELGYSFELWTNRLLAKHAREHCKENGHPSLARINRGTISKILNKSDVRPHKITYYLERRDPDPEAKQAVDPARVAAACRDPRESRLRLNQPNRRSCDSQHPRVGGRPESLPGLQPDFDRIVESEESRPRQRCG